MADTMAEYRVEIGVDVVNKAKATTIPIPNTSKIEGAYTSMLSRFFKKMSELTTVFVFGRSFFNRVSRSFAWVANGFRDIVIRPITRMISSIWKSFTNLPATIFGYQAGFTGLMKGAVGFADELYKASMSFRQIFQNNGRSAGSGQSFYEDVVEFAKRTPFETQQVVGASRTMLAAGWNPDKLIGDLTIVGDKMAQLGDSTGEGAQSVVNNLVKMKFRGFAQAREVNYLATQGVPAWRYITKKIVESGKALQYGLQGPANAGAWTVEDYDRNVGAVRKLSERRLISAEFGINAILEGMETEAAGFMKKAARATLSGVNIILRDALEVEWMQMFGKGILEGETNTDIRKNQWTAEEGSANGWAPYGGLRQMMVDISNSIDEYDAKGNKKGKGILKMWGNTWANFGKTIGQGIYGTFKQVWSKVEKVWESDEFKKAPFFKQLMMTVGGLGEGLDGVLANITKWYNGPGKAQISTIAGQAGAFLGELVNLILRPFTGGKGPGTTGVVADMAETAGTSFVTTFWGSAGDNITKIAGTITEKFAELAYKAGIGIKDGLLKIMNEYPILKWFFGLWGFSVGMGAVMNAGVLLSGLGSALSKLGMLGAGGAAATTTATTVAGSAAGATGLAAITSWIGPIVAAVIVSAVVAAAVSSLFKWLKRGEAEEGTLPAYKKSIAEAIEARNKQTSVVGQVLSGSTGNMSMSALDLILGQNGLGNRDENVANMTKLWPQFAPKEQQFLAKNYGQFFGDLPITPEARGYETDYQSLFPNTPINVDVKPQITINQNGSSVAQVAGMVADQTRAAMFISMLKTLPAKGPVK